MTTLRALFASKHLQGLAGFKPIQQTMENACGCCALAAALKHLGEHAYEQMVVETLQPGAVVGISFEAALRYLSSRGFRATAWSKYPIEQIIGRVRSGRITILDWPDRGDHWLTVVGIEPVERVIVLADPSRAEAFVGVPFDVFTAGWAAGPRRALVIDRFRNEEAPDVAKKRQRFAVLDYEANARHHA